jgi:hypothetical protein
LHREFALDLEGEITEDIGKEPKLSLSVYLNGYLGPERTTTLCVSKYLNRFYIYQNSRQLDDGQVPVKGDVTMKYNTSIWLSEFRKGLYTVRVEMYASEEVRGKRMTGWEASAWINGGRGDGCGGWE